MSEIVKIKIITIFNKKIKEVYNPKKYLDFIQMITSESTKEEVGNFVFKELKLKEDIKNALIKEEISGDILPDLTEEDYNALGIKTIQMRKIKKFLDQNQDKFGEKKYTEVISIYSEPKEVSEFFQKSLNFYGNSDGKGSLELTDESIKALGLNLEKKKKIN